MIKRRTFLTTAYTGLAGNIGNVSPIRLPDGTLCASAADGAGAVRAYAV